MSLLLECALDTARTLPFLFGAYLLLEWIAHRAGERSRERLGRAGRLGPLVGALLGLFPQCGFSVAAAGFYADRVITPGTLVAVFLSTSDEALPLLLKPGGFHSILPLVAIKLVLAASAGLLIDFALAPLWRRTWEREGELHHSHEHFAHDDDDDHCHHNHCREGGIVVEALRHTAKVAAIVFAATVVLDFALDTMGEERVSGLLMTGHALQPVAAAIFGLIPSCAASVMLANLYLEGAITFGSVVAGLATGAGMGSLVLIQSCHRKREALIILATLLLFGAATGLAIDALT